jgi:Fibronectin type III domain
MVHVRARRRVSPFLILLLGGAILSSGESCDVSSSSDSSPGGSARMTVSTKPTSCREGESADCYRATTIVIDGSGFRAGSTLKIYIPTSPDVPELPEIVFSQSENIGGAGRFHVESFRQSCKPLARPTEVRPTLVLAADDANGARLSFTFIATRELVCQPPFAMLTYVRPCGDPLCPTLTTDSPTSIGVHWDIRDVDYNQYFIRYGLIGDEEHWQTTRNFGADVSAVAINNLSPGTGYGFDLLACFSAAFGSTQICDPWHPVGVAATAPG